MGEMNHVVKFNYILGYLNVCISTLYNLEEERSPIYVCLIIYIHDYFLMCKGDKSMVWN